MGAERVLLAFVKGDMNSDSLIAALRPRVMLSEDEDGTIRVNYAGEPLPHVTFTRADIARVLEAAIANQVTMEELSRWANLITLLDCFDLESSACAGDDVWDILDRLAHPELSGLDDTWRLREIREDLGTISG
jgi:hypothetical protein